MKNISSYVLDHWSKSSSKGSTLRHALTGEEVYRISSEDLPWADIIPYAKTVGGPALRQLTFHQRAKILKEVAKILTEKKEELYALAPIMGAGRKDAWVDIEGGIGTLFTYASKAKKELPNHTVATDGAVEVVSKEGQFVGQHIYLSRQGVALHINAFNFPCWGLLEKFAPSFLAGVPSIIKPASATAFLSEALVRLMVETKLLPEGSIQLISGSLDASLFAALDGQDTVTFTGSQNTGLKLKSHPNILRKNVRFNMEADSLNCCILGSDIDSEHPLFAIFTKEVVREVISKAGQKCTAIRRIMVPTQQIPAVKKSLVEAFSRVVMGDPARKEVQLGPLVNIQQAEDVRGVIQQLSRHCELVYGEEASGAFLSPHLFYAPHPLETPEVHELEAFGPVTTLMPYRNVEELINLCKMGEGSLVGSMVSADDSLVRQVVEGIGSYHGRLLVLNEESKKESTGHGSPLPHFVHGGPGRAGGGEELGGIRSVFHYMQRLALQSSPETITQVTSEWVRGSKTFEREKHPFRCTFDELSVGQTYWTARRTLTEADITNFAGISGDFFYAHMDAIAAEHSLFKKRVLHGYFVLSAAAGLFVDPKVGPVLANYGLERLRFIEPVYPGDTIEVRLTVKKKTDKEPRPDMIPQGVVEFDVEIFNQEKKVVASYSILTLVGKSAVKNA